jgi:hypothetical protein
LLGVGASERRIEAEEVEVEVDVVLDINEFSGVAEGNGRLCRGLGVC